MRPTGNCRPALEERDTAFLPDLPQPAPAAAPDSFLAMRASGRGGWRDAGKGRELCAAPCVARALVACLAPDRQHPRMSVLLTCSGVLVIRRQAHYKSASHAQSSTHTSLPFPSSLYDLPHSLLWPRRSLALLLLAQAVASPARRPCRAPPRRACSSPLAASLATSRRASTPSVWAPAPQSTCAPVSRGGTGGTQGAGLVHGGRASISRRALHACMQHVASPCHES